YGCAQWQSHNRQLNELLKINTFKSDSSQFHSTGKIKLEWDVLGATDVTLLIKRAGSVTSKMNNLSLTHGEMEISVNEITEFTLIATGFRGEALSQNLITNGMINVDQPEKPKLADAPILKEGNQIVGVIPSNVDVNSGGSATYSTKIEVVKGPGGFSPDLSVNYSSSGKSGLLGVGWRLSGHSVISRCRRYLEEDGYYKNVELSSSDAICYGSERLVPVKKGQALTSGSEYRLKSEPNFKVVYSTSGFTVYLQSGEQWLFGNGENAQQVDEGSGTVYKWYLSHKKDSFGNVIFYKYYNTTGTQLRLSEITYANNKVNFLYETRADSSYKYFLGNTVVNDQVLSAIEVFNHDAIKVTDYSFKYKNSATTGRSLLESISRCNGSDMCLPKTTFSYSDKVPVGLVNSNNALTIDLKKEFGFSGKLVDPVMQLMDYNGDGNLELAVYASDLESKKYNIYNFDLSSSIVKRGSLNEQGISYVVKDERLGRQRHYINWYATDLDNNGKDEITVREEKTLRFGNVYGDLFGTGEQLASADYVGLLKSIEREYSDCGDLEKCDAYVTVNQLLDVNYDGLLDRIYEVYAFSTDIDEPILQGEQYFASMINTSNGTQFSEIKAVEFSAIRDPADRWDTHAMGDVNGDGYIDFGSYCYNGIDFIKCDSHTHLNDINTNKFGLASYQDINLDGKSDSLYWDNGVLYAQISNPSANKTISLGQFTPPKEWQPSPGRKGRFMWADLDGDGSPALIYLEESKDIIHILHDANTNNTAVDKLISIKEGNGLGLTHSFEYKSIGSNIYQKHTDANQKNWGNGSVVRDVKSGGYVVSEWKINTGQNASGKELIQDYQYKYAGLKFQAGGRGSLGFSEVTKTSLNNKQVTTRKFRQDYPFTGQQEEVTVTYQGSVLQKTKVKEWQVLSILDGRVAKVLPEKVETQRYSFGIDNGVITSGTSRILSLNRMQTTIYETVDKDYIRIKSNSDEYIDKLSGYTWKKHTSYDYYDEDINNWYIARPSLETITQSRTNGVDTLQSIQRINSTYNSNNLAEAVEIGVDEYGDPVSEQEYLKETFKYDKYGNLIENRKCSSHYNSTCVNKKISDKTLPAYHVLQKFTYRYHEGRYLTSEHNGLFEVFSYSDHNSLNLPRVVQDAAGMKTHLSYDTFGRRYFAASEDGSYSKQIRSLCTNCPVGVKYLIALESSSSPDLIQYFDASDRLVYQKTRSLTQEWINQVNKYDAFSQLIAQSNPYKFGQTVHFTEYRYDDLNRLWHTRKPSSIEETNRIDKGIKYTNISGNHSGSNSSSAVIDYTLGKKMSGIGLLVSSFDADNNETHYNYNEQRLLRRVLNPDGSELFVKYNARGHKTGMSDPDKGDIEFTNNALGEMVTRTAPDGSIITYHYDSVGRIKEKSARNLFGQDEDYSYFIYKKSLLDEQGSKDGAKSYFAYDHLGRISAVGYELEDQQFMTSTTYDHLGRVFQQFDASGNFRGVQYSYKNGYVAALKEASNSDLTYYQAGGMDAFGNITKWRSGSGIVTETKSDLITGFLTNIKSGNGAVQNLIYEFDGLGNLRSRKDKIGDAARSELLEVFTYDNMNRLETVTMNGFNTLTMDYFDNGNIKTKSDLQSGKTYTYGTKPSQCSNYAGKHAVSVVGTLNYCYDLRGNQTKSYNGSSLQRQVSYTYFDKPRLITSPVATSEFKYDANNARFKRTDLEGDKQTATYYVGNTEVIVEDNKYSYRRYIGNHALSIISDESDSTRYLFKDHIGSIDVITNEAGQLIERLSYDAFGRRRDGLTWGKIQQLYVDPAVKNAAEITDKGFTGHEHVDHAEAIHMGGRIYDPTLGRFMQADPIVESPESAQSLNRYSYVFNNPLSFTDPTGYTCTIDDWQSAPKCIHDMLEDANEILADIDIKSEVQERVQEFSANYVSADIAAGVDKSISGQALYIGYKAVPYIGEVAGFVYDITIPDLRKPLQLALNGEFGGALSGTVEEVVLKKFRMVYRVGENVVDSVEKVANNKVTKRGNSSQYSVSFDTKLSKDMYPGRSDKAHFQQANQNLHQQMKADPEFASMMEALHPGITKGVQPGARGAYPRRAPTKDVTWHHGVEPGNMQLVPRSQHNAPGAVQETLHPDGLGGMSIWGGGR
ncbi:hypothetical protein N475_19080, partial [Pseudoalteromonas luteoviolacea DSM 6061]